MTTHPSAAPTTRQVTAGLFMSLDGVVEAPNQWVGPYVNDEVAAQMAAGIARADAVLLGRATYELFTGLWAHQGDDIPMARFLNHSPKYVVSTTLTALPWQPATVIRGDLRRELERLKRMPGKNIQVPGSPRLVRSLLRDGLLDELALSICPVVVGAGLRLFDDMPARVALELVDARVFAHGVVTLAYRPARPVRDA